MLSRLSKQIGGSRPARRDPANRNRWVGEGATNRVVSGEGGAFHLLGPAPRGQNRIPPRGRIVRPLPAAVVFQRANGQKGRVRAGACAVDFLVPAGACAAGSVGADHAAYLRRSFPGTSVGSTLDEGPVKDVVLFSDLHDIPLIGASPEALVPPPSDGASLQSGAPKVPFWGRLEPFWGPIATVWFFFGVGKPGCLLRADVSRQRRQVLSFQEVKISDAGFRAARDHGVRNYVRY